MTDESKEERTARLNFFTDAARAGLHAAGADILEQMNANEVPNAATCLLAGACQFVAEVYEQTAEQIGADKAKFRKQLVTGVGMYFDHYCRMTVEESVASASQ